MKIYEPGLAGLREYLADNNSITSREAARKLNEMTSGDLSKGICRLKERGMVIESHRKKDPTGKQYTRYVFVGMKGHVKKQKPAMLAKVDARVAQGEAE